MQLPLSLQFSFRQMTLPEVVAPLPGDPRDRSQALEGEAPGMLGSHPGTLQSLPSGWTAQNPRPPTASQPLTILHLDTLITWLLPGLSAPGAEAPRRTPSWHLLRRTVLPRQALEVWPCRWNPHFPLPAQAQRSCAPLCSPESRCSNRDSLLTSHEAGPRRPFLSSSPHSPSPPPLCLCGPSPVWQQQLLVEGLFPLPGPPRRLCRDLQWQGPGVMGLENQVLVQTQSVHLGNSETATRGPRPFCQGANGPTLLPLTSAFQAVGVHSAAQLRFT